MLKHGLIALALGSCFSATVNGQSQDLNPAPVIIADEIKSLLSLAPIEATLAGGDTSNEISISQTGAAFIKVHFSHLKLPEGAYITVSDPQGVESYQYDGIEQGNATFNGNNGEDGLTQFSAMSVFGDTAIIRLTMPSGVLWEENHQIKIDKFTAGHNEAMVPAIQSDDITPESSCGANERTDVVCWATSHPVQYERTRPVARLLMSGSGLCTGWRVGNDNHMFTNNHCLSTQGTLEDTEIWFNYQNTTCGGSTKAGTIKVTGKDLLKTDYNLDYSLFSVNDFNTISSFGNYGLETRVPTFGELIYIAQHGAGNPKELSIVSDQNSGGLCQIDVATTNGRGTNSDTGYLCDTTGGSSGSPVIAASSNKVIALHHFGGCENQGVQINQIWPQVSSHFGGVPPQGDADSVPGNVPPTAQASISCTGLSCNFDGSSSSDSDGTIASYSWDFGDNSNGTNSTTSHTYSNAGTFSVSLTVTDNESATSSYTEHVTVSDGSATNELQSGVPINNLAASKGDELSYYIATTEDNSILSVKIAGGTGDADLYVKIGAEPTSSDYDCRPYAKGNDEVCTVTVNTADNVFVSLVAYADFSNVELVADITVASDDGFPKTNLAADKGDWLNYVYTVPAGVSQIEVSTSGGSGDADLYVKNGSVPTTGEYDCRPYQSGNNESCTVTVSTGDEVYIGLRAYNTFSGVGLDLN
jgi:serine protease